MRRLDDMHTISTDALAQVMGGADVEGNVVDTAAEKFEACIGAAKLKLSALRRRSLEDLQAYAREVQGCSKQFLPA